MLINLAGWILEHMLSVGVTKIEKFFFDSNLKDELNKAVTEWAELLPPESKLVPESLFFSLNKGSSSQISEIDLITKLDDYFNPSLDQWFSALFLRWENISKSASQQTLQPFYQLPESEAVSYLKQLAVKLQNVCDRDAIYFQTTIAQAIRSIQTQLSAERDHASSDLTISVLEIFLQPHFPTYELNFAILNCSSQQFLLTGLVFKIDYCVENITFALTHPGKPVVPIRFNAHLSPNLKTVKISEDRLHYKPSDTDFFDGEITGDSGWKYFLSISAMQRNIVTGDRKEVTSARFWLDFPKI